MGIKFNPFTSNFDFTGSSSSSDDISLQWMRGGTLVANVYLFNGGIPSNVSGLVSPLTGTMVKMTISCEASSTFSVKLQRRNGVSFVDLTTVSVSAARTKIQTLSISVSSGDELAALVSSGSADNIVITLDLQGTP